MDFHVERMPSPFSALPQPSGKALRKALWRDPEAGLHLAFGNRQSIVKFRGIREITHTELIEPVQGTRLAFAVDQQFHFEPLRVHWAIITSRSCAQRIRPNVEVEANVSNVSSADSTYPRGRKGVSQPRTVLHPPARNTRRAPAIGDSPAAK